MQEFQETWVRFLALENPLKKEKATHTSIPAWEIPWTEEPGGLQSIGLQIGHDFATEHQTTKQSRSQFQEEVLGASIVKTNYNTQH